MMAISRTYNQFNKSIKLNGWYDCVYMVKRFFALKSKTEEEYDVVQDIGEW